MSSKFEGLPNVLIEAQKYGIPIISSNCPTGPNEILMNGKLGELFPVGNHNILANKLLNFFEYVGKNSLIIYIFHQPILFSLFLMFIQLTS